MLKIKNNYAFIDGQNLHLGTMTSEKPWKIDFLKLKIYLEKKYDVKKIYYFIGFYNNKNKKLYKKINKSGIKLVFKEYNHIMIGRKKGNVDSDIIFEIVTKMYYKENFDKIIIVSGDGDYKKLVDFLIKENRFKKILFPNKKFSSCLYNKIRSKFYDCLENKEVKNKISLKQKGTLGS